MNSSLVKEEEVTRNLYEKYGAIIAAVEVWKILGYRTIHGYRKARLRKSLPIREFEIPGRRGKYVLTRDVERWLDSL